ncbi:MAG: carboxypeptidase-like regulatory domain-containing protein, partial [Candidatus Methanoperedens sp.]|nr:carboxypeptidase-like regulatory domain-containing protein [Candidatus Methanoperedens sp.]
MTSYNASGYVFDNFGTGLEGVLIQNGSNQSNTSASGYYSITNLSNGNYNFSYSKAGFDTGYLEITIS